MPKVMEASILWLIHMIIKLWHFYPPKIAKLVSLSL